MDDETRWNLIHQKNLPASEWHSKYAQEKEIGFPRNSLIVDLGAGTGADALYFLKKGHRVVALDISTFALKVLQDRAKLANLGTRLVVKQVDFGLQDLPIKPESVDVAYSRISLNYFGAKQTAKLFKDIFRILKKGANAYLTFKSPDDLKEMEYLQKSATVYEENVYIEGGMLRSRFNVNQLNTILGKTGIVSYKVLPYKEDLGQKGEGHHPILYVNEVSFVK